MSGLWDSIFRVLKDNGTDIAGKGFGTVGDALGFASTLTGGKTSENLTIASGISTGVSGVSGLIGSGRAIRKSSATMKDELVSANTERENRNEDATKKAKERAAVARKDNVNGWLDATENFLNVGTGVADVATGILVRYRKKGKLAKKDKENAAKKRKEAVFKLVTGGLKILNAAGTMGQGIFMNQSPSESLDSDNSTTKFWSIWRNVFSGAATVPGLIDSFFTGKKVVNEVDSKLHPRISGTSQEEIPQPVGELPEMESQQEEESQELEPFVISE